MDSQEKHSRPLYNSRIFDTYIKLVKRRYSFVNISELLSYVKMEIYQVEDEGHWFTQENANLFHERLRTLTGNKDIAKEAGRYSASPEFLGGIKTHLLGLGSPAIVFSLVGKITSKFVKSSTYESRKTGKNQVEILVTPNEGVREEPFQCENRQGYMEAIPKLFNYKLPKIEHPECMFRGGKVCRYLVSWQESRSVFWKRIGKIVTLSLGAACIASLFFGASVLVLLAMLSTSVTIVVMIGWYAEALTTRELRMAMDSLKGSSDELIEQININYNNALLINDINKSFSKEADINGILANVIEVLKKRLEYDRGLVMLANTDKTRLIYRAGFGYTDEQAEIFGQASFHLDKPESRGAFVVSFKEQKPFLVNDIEELKDRFSPRSYELARMLGAKSFICCPIVYENNSLGVLAVDNVKTKRPLLQRDLSLLTGVASQIGIAIEQKKLESLLIKAKEEWEEAFHTINDAITIQDREFNIIRANRAAEEILGQPLSKILQQKCYKTYHGTDSPPDTCLSCMTLKTGEVTVMEVFEPHLKRYVEIKALPRLDDRNNIIGLIHVVRDIEARKKAEEELLDRTQELSEYQVRLQSLASHLQNVIEQERIAIARDIHDDLGQVLTALKMDLGWLEKRLPADNPDIEVKLDDMRSTINKTVQDVKDICSRLRPGILDDLGAPSAMEWYANIFEDRTGITCSLALPEKMVKLDQERSTAIYRIFQESLTNAYHHARASRIDISLAVRDGGVILKVNDNGKGIDPRALEYPESYGLLGMRERVNSFGGTFRIGEREDEADGTQLEVTIPFVDERQE